MKVFDFYLRNLTALQRTQNFSVPVQVFFKFLMYSIHFFRFTVPVYNGQLEPQFSKML
jgi:hypothetical protein